MAAKKKKTAKKAAAAKAKAPKAAKPKAKKARSKHIPLPILKRRLVRLKGIVESRSK